MLGFLFDFRRFISLFLRHFDGLGLKRIDVYCNKMLELFDMLFIWPEIALNKCKNKNK